MGKNSISSRNWSNRWLCFLLAFSVVMLVATDCFAASGINIEDFEKGVKKEFTGDFVSFSEDKDSKGNIMLKGMILSGVGGKYTIDGLADKKGNLKSIDYSIRISQTVLSDFERLSTRQILSDMQNFRNVIVARLNMELDFVSYLSIIRLIENDNKTNDTDLMDTLLEARTKPQVISKWKRSVTSEKIDDSYGQIIISAKLK